MISLHIIPARWSTILSEDIRLLYSWGFAAPHPASGNFIALDPQYVDAYLTRGVAYFDKGDYDDAIADYDQVIAIDPQFALAYANRGVAYKNKGDLDRAIADLEVALELGLDPSTKEAVESILEELGQ